jgi:hypothetical protein
MNFFVWLNVCNCMDTQRKRFIVRWFCLRLLALALLCCANFVLFSQSAMAQEGNVQTNLPSNLPTRLPRPGRGHGRYMREDTQRMEEASSPLSLPTSLHTRTPTTLPSDGRPFALGVEHKQLVPDSLTGSSVVDSGAPLKAQQGLFDKPVTSMFALQDSRNLLNNPVLNANLQKRSAEMPVLSVQLLSNFDLELIVDSSLSMRRRDCPNFLSRWEWCGMQTKELSRDLAPFVVKGLTLTEFASDYQVYPNSKPERINQLFENPDFMWGTKLAEPLQDRLSNFFARRRPGSKPMLIAVITDGVPAPRYEPMLVIQTLINATKKMRDASEVTVVFFQIGGSGEKGRRFLSELDYNLVKYGARFDIVRTVSFEHLQKVGLSQALVQTVQDFAVQSKSRERASKNDD